MTAPLIVVKIHTSYNDGYALAVHGEPLDDTIFGPTENGYFAAVKDIAAWRKTGEALPDYINPAVVKNPAKRGNQ